MSQDQPKDAPSAAAAAAPVPAIDFRSRAKIADIIANSVAYIGKQITVAGWIRDQRFSTVPITSTHTLCLDWEAKISSAF